MVNGGRGDNQSKYPAARMASEVLTNMIELYVDQNKNEIEVYSPCQLGSDEFSPSEEGGPTPLQLWHRDDQNGASR